MESSTHRSKRVRNTLGGILATLCLTGLLMSGGTTAALAAPVLTEPEAPPTGEAAQEDPADASAEQTDDAQADPAATDTAETPVEAPADPTATPADAPVDATAEPEPSTQSPAAAPVQPAAPTEQAPGDGTIQPLAVPDEPTGFTYSQVQGSDITLALSWDAVPGVRYTLKWVQGNSYSETGARTALDGVETGTYTHSGLGGATGYSYRLWAENDDGLSTPVTLSAAQTLPHTPTNLVAGGNPGGTSMHLGWTAARPPSPNVATMFYTTYRLIDGEWAWIGTTAATNATDHGLEPDTEYTYRIGSSYNHSATNFQEQLATGRTMLADPDPVAEPGCDSVQLSWQAGSPHGGVSYEIWRVTDDGEWDDWTLVDTVTDEVELTDTGVAEDTAFYYEVRASKPGQPTVGVEQGVFTQTAVCPLAPDTIDAVGTDIDAISVNWSEVDGATGYLLQRSEVGPAMARAAGPWVDVAEVGADVLEYEDIGLTADTEYSYRVITLQDALRSQPSATANAVTDAIPAPDPSATAVSPTEIEVGWEPIPDAVGYELYRSTTAGELGELVYAGSETDFRDTGLQPATAYFYTARTIMTGVSGIPQSSPDSPQVTVTTPAAPVTPTEPPTPTPTQPTEPTAPAGPAGGASTGASRSLASTGFDGLWLLAAGAALLLAGGAGIRFAGSRRASGN